MYDPAVYLTNNEYLQKYKYRIDVQATVEQLQLYILGRCPSNEHQLVHGEKRINDIINSKNKLETEGIYIEDIISVLKGDKPAAQLEIGHQKGGNYFCFNCKIDSFFTKNIFHSFSLYQISMLKFQRSMEFSVHRDLPVLKDLLACEVHGIQSVSALMFS